MTSLRVEGPTWAALVFCYCGFAALTLFAGAQPILYLPLAVILAFHSSLQHEAIHGHPTRWPLVNEALVAFPIGLAFPYRRYRDLHLSHHLDARLTDPYDDPESWYLDPIAWGMLPGWAQWLLRANNCVLGRMLIGPALSVIRFVRGDLRSLRQGDRGVILAWALHLIGAAPVLLWLAYAGVSPLYYGLACYAGLALINLRSFLEHQAEERIANRSVIVEHRGLLSLLYLNNNLHAVHHARPDLAWSLIPKFYRENRTRFLQMNGGYVFSSYWAVLRAHGLRAKEPAAHPDMKSLGR